MIIAGELQFNPFNSQRWLRWYPYIIQQTSDKNTQTYQVEVDLDQTPNSCHKFISKCVAAGGEN